MIGSRLGPYEITAKLGEGGMGEVYRASDTKLKREVAIKVLPAAFTLDKERLARFEREAQLLAQLRHPNIAAVYGLEETDRGRALVMELVGGEDLSVVIERGPVAFGEAVSIARQIALALEAAHERGIVHRDLKPANIKVGDDLTVKVLDFGLAKATDTGGVNPDLVNSPTLTARATQLGVVLGTAAYMAPEQAKGRSVDRRADVWAFGVVLYELLTGKRAFAGDDMSEVFAAVLKTEPDWSALPADTPAAVQRLLRRCLVKDPRNRLSSMADARLELDEHEPEAPTPPGATPLARPLLARLWPAAAGALATVLVAALFWPSQRPPAEVTRLSIVEPPGAALYPDSAQVEISPDGRTAAFVVGSPMRPDTQLWVRSLDTLSSRRIEGADGALLPFWSPDSSRIGFWADGKLKTVSVAGGRPELLCNSPNFRGGAWNSAGVIVFARGFSEPLFSVSANGSEPVQVTTLDPSRRESGHRFPLFLPDGEHFLYAALPGRGGKFDIFAGTLHDRSRVLIASLETAPVYAEPGWLVFGRHGTLAAQRFDARALKLSGDAVSLGDEPTAILDAAVSFTAGHLASASSTGTLAYYSTASNRTKALWLDATGNPTTGPALPPGRYTEVVVSPRGTRAVVVLNASASESALFLWELERGGLTPLSKGAGLNEHPVWSPDESRVVFSSDRDGIADLFTKEVGTDAPERPFYRSTAQFKDPVSWSPDGKWIALTQANAQTNQDIYLLPTFGEPTLTPYVVQPGRDEAQAVSPDSKWMLHLSEGSGSLELYLSSFPTPGHSIRLSTEGAGGQSQSWWTADQRHVLFVNPTSTSVMEVDVETGETLRAGTPRQVARLPPGLVTLDAMPDRRKWIALVSEGVGPASLTVVHNWMAALKK